MEVTVTFGGKDYTLLLYVANIFVLLSWQYPYFDLC